MTRKDTILIAVVINAGLLAILFTTAVIYDTDRNVEQTEFVTSVPNLKEAPLDSEPTLIAVASSTGDEVDNVLKYYSQPSTQMISTPVQVENEPSEQVIVPPEPENDEPIQESTVSPQEDFIEVKIKKGDMLEKIARVHKTTVGAIKRTNHLKDERLSIGQVIKIPINSNLADSQASSSDAKKSEQKTESKSEAPKEQKPAVIYHIVQRGDNPWKIAKQYGVKYDDILRLNHLDEEKAKNMKIGDRIRVK